MSQPGDEFIGCVLGDEVDSEPALAQVLDGGSEVIDFVIDDEEAVV